MSLINEMLCDLEKRRKREKCSPDGSVNPVVAETASSSPKLLLGSGILLVAGVVWVVIKFIIPGSMLTTPVVLSSQAHQGASSVAAVSTGVVAKVRAPDTDFVPKEKLQPSAIPVTPEGELPVSEKLEAELLSLAVDESKGSAQLQLVFAHLPEYRLLRDGSGYAQLVVTFNDLRIGKDFEIPPLAGPLLKRVSLLPQKQVLQLLIDLEEDAQVQSVQMADASEQHYRLLIEVSAPQPLVEKPQKQNPLPASVTQPVEVPVEVNNPTTAKIAKNKKLLRNDKQAFQTGLEQLTRQDLLAAETSFTRALTLNPEFLEARLQLVGILQQQIKIGQAEDLFLQGLTLTPGNTDLRKGYARLLLNEQRQAEAITLLETHPVPAIARDLEYHALLAALMQETGRFSAAASIYDRLVQIRPQEALWWMGLAISLEQSERFDQARDAYQEALSLQGLRPDLQKYIQSRLQTL